MFVLVRTDTPSLDDLQPAALATSLHRAAAAWTRTFLVSARQPDPQLAERLCRETLAFGLALLEARLSAFDPIQAADLLAAVRQAVWTLHVRRTCRAGHLALASARADDTEFDRQWLTHTAGDAGEFQFTSAMFDEFCEFTGLGSRELVGGGENLAALVFYLVIHGRVFASASVTREQRRWLVRASRECRLFLTQALDHWLHLSP